MQSKFIIIIDNVSISIRSIISVCVVFTFKPLKMALYLHLTLSTACWVFWRAVMLGPFLWALHNLSNSVRPWELPLSWIPFWACRWTFFSSGSSPFPFLFSVYEYTVAVFRHTRRGHQIPLQMFVSHHGIAGNWTQDLWKSSQCS